MKCEVNLVVCRTYKRGVSSKVSIKLKLSESELNRLHTCQRKWWTDLKGVKREEEGCETFHQKKKEYSSEHKKIQFFSFSPTSSSHRSQPVKISWNMTKAKRKETENTTRIKNEKVFPLLEIIFPVFAHISRDFEWDWTLNCFPCSLCCFHVSRATRFVALSLK